MKRFYLPMVVLVVILTVNFRFPFHLSAAEISRFGNPAKDNPLYSLPAMAADEKGFWGQNGLEGKWFPFASGVAMVNALAAGSLDFGMAGSVLMIQSIARGVPVVIVTDMETVEQFYFWVRADSLIKKIPDLEGQDIGTSRLGSLTQAFGQAVEKQLGLTRSFKFVAVGGTTNSIAALKAGKVAATINSTLAMARLMYTGEVRHILSVRDYLPKPWVDMVLTARKDLVNRNPDLVARTVRTILQATRFVKEDRNWALAKMKTEFGYPQELAELMYKLITYTDKGRIDRQGVDNIRNFIIEYKLLTKEKIPPTDELFTNKFTG